MDRAHETDTQGNNSSKCVVQNVLPLSTGGSRASIPVAQGSLTTSVDDSASAPLLKATTI